MGSMIEELNVKCGDIFKLFVLFELIVLLYNWKFYRYWFIYILLKDLCLGFE